MEATAAIPPEAGDLPLPPTDEPETELLTAQPGLDPADIETLENAASATARRPIRILRAGEPIPDGTRRITAAHISIARKDGSVTTIDRLRRDRSAPPVDIDVIRVALDIEDAASVPEQRAYLTDVALLHSAARGRNDTTNPALTAERGLVFTPIGELAAMMQRAYLPARHPGKPRRERRRRERFRRACIRELMKQPNLRRDARDWLIRDLVRRKIAALTPADAEETTIRLRRTGHTSIGFDYRRQ